MKLSVKLQQSMYQIQTMHLTRIQIDEEQNDKAEQSDNTADHDSTQQYQDKKTIAALCYSSDPHRQIFTFIFQISVTIAELILIFLLLYLH
jgi:translation initiation factor 2B subunit (eIF-2B alpha/beta/delta family)